MPEQNATPRTWQKPGDLEPPEDVDVLSAGNGWFLVRGRPGWFWTKRASRIERPGYEWSGVCEVGPPGTLTEVVDPWPHVPRQKQEREAGRG